MIRRKPKKLQGRKKYEEPKFHVCFLLASMITISTKNLDCFLSICCKTTFSIPDEIGKAIERGESVTLQENELEIVGMENTSYAHCPDCGFLLSSEYTYCPKCGRKI